MWKKSNNCSVHKENLYKRASNVLYDKEFSELFGRNYIFASKVVSWMEITTCQISFRIC